MNNIIRKHAYLIMAHNEPYILEKLLKLIDDERNDIYIHIDKKWKDFSFEYFAKIVKKSKLYYTKRLDVRWGTYKQIECELLLWETSSNNNKYEYYHLLSGVDMPLCTQDIIHQYFKEHQGKEFICFDFHDKVLNTVEDRIKYYHFFIKNKRSSNIRVKIFSQKLYTRSLKIQQRFGVNRIKNLNLTVRKGANWVSITDNLVKYILKRKKQIRKIFKDSLCADEVFLQTLVYNSDFYKNLINYTDNDIVAIKRYIDWNRGGPYCFKSIDFNELISSNCFFARKFSTKVDIDIIDKIYNYVKERQ